MMFSTLSFNHPTLFIQEDQKKFNALFVPDIYIQYVILIYTIPSINKKVLHVYIFISITLGTHLNEKGAL